MGALRVNKKLLQREKCGINLARASQARDDPKELKFNILNFLGEGIAS